MNRTYIQHYKSLFTLGIPIVIGQVGVIILGFADTLMIGHHSTNELAAASFVNNMFTLAIIFATGFSYGLTPIVGSLFGRGETSVVGRMLKNSIFANVLLAVLLTFIMWVLYLNIHRLGQPEELLPLMRPYFIVLLISLLFVLLFNAFKQFADGITDTRVSMWLLLGGNVMNIIGNYSLIFGKLGMPALGAEGAAISTSVARGVSMVVLFVILFRKHIPRFPLHYFRPFPWVELKNLLKVGLPSAGENMSYSFSQVVITYFINILGNNALATRTYTVNIVMFVYLFAIAMAQGGAISIGHLVGQKKIRAAYLLGKYVMRLSILVSLVLSCVWAASGHFIFSMLTDNQEIIKMGVTIMMVDIIVEIGRAVNIYATNALRSAGDVNFPFYVGVAVQWTVSVGFSYLFGIYWGWGLVGMWCAFLLDENIRALLFVKRWNSMRWAKKGFIK